MYRNVIARLKDSCSAMVSIEGGECYSAAQLSRTLICRIYVGKSSILLDTAINERHMVRIQPVLPIGYGVHCSSGPFYDRSRQVIDAIVSIYVGFTVHICR